MEERYRKELNWWFAELTMDPEVQVERYLTIFRELKSRLSKFGVGILLWNMKGLVDIDNPDDVSRVRLILKVLDPDLTSLITYSTKPILIQSAGLLESVPKSLSKNRLLNLTILLTPSVVMKTHANIWI